MRRLARASVTGATVFAAVQMIDIQVTGRHGSDTPVLAFEALTRRTVPGGVPRMLVGYAVQSSLAPAAAVAGMLAGRSAVRRFGAALLAPFVVAGIINPALGASSWPWHWTRDAWTREFTLKSVLAVAVVATL